MYTVRTVKVVSLDQIRVALTGIDVIEEVAQGFVAYSEGRAVVPPVGELLFDNPPGDVHIKYGYIKGDEHYVIKIASGFPENSKGELPSNNGMMLVFKQETGEPVAILADEGHLTDLRTAAAGAIAARHLAPKIVTRIGILGSGTQARLQLMYLRKVIPCRNVLLWGRNPETVEHSLEHMKAAGFSVECAGDPGEVAAACNLIVTTTPAVKPLLNSHDIVPGTHITAVGSDTEDKQELDPDILARADLVVADSISQCVLRGEISHALRAGVISMDDSKKLVELGQIIARQAEGRTAPHQITVADLTGVAVQDIRIAVAVCRAL